VPAGPRVTILMPVYNGQRFVDEAIESVLGQGYDDFEFVIVDDGSTDATPSILAKWAARDARIAVHRSPRNEGIPAALNRGLAIARGEYVARQDADDLCVAGRLAKQVAVLDAEPGVVLVTAGYELIDFQGRRRGWRMRFEAPEVVEYLMHFSNAIGGHGQVMFRREAVLAAGGYRVEYEYSQDYDLWSRLMARGRMVILPISGMRHRLHDHRVSITSGQRQERYSMSISRRNLTAFLGHEVDDEEFESLSAVWRQSDHRLSAAAANRLFREAYARFRQTNTNRIHRRRARMAKAHNWFLSAAMNAKRGRLLAVLPYLGYSLRWHPLGFLTGAWAIAKRAARSIWRHARNIAGSEQRPPSRLRLRQ
jgi:glycosyltransferase involved in cell wall biosynthesis